MPRLLEGKTGLILGIANKRSIAWGVANSVNSAGARLVLTHQNERLGENVRDLAPLLNNPIVLPCDVTSDEQIQALMEYASMRSPRDPSKLSRRRPLAEFPT